MADKKISQLTAITGTVLDDADLIPVVDSSASETKKITFGEFKTALDQATGFVRLTGDTMTGNLSFGDNDKAIFGAGSDLQIYHNGSNSFIDDVGTGNLFVRANNLRLSNADNSQYYLIADNAGFVKLNYAGAEKLATTSTGIDVTGTVTADGLTVDGAATITDTGNVIGSNAPLLIKSNNGAATTSYGWDNLTSNYDYAIKTNGSERLRIDASGNLLVGTTSARTGINSLTLEAANSFFMMRAAGTGSLTQLAFVRDTTGTPFQVGSIDTTGTATAYNTASDYRLKEDIQPVANAADRLLQLKPINFAWKADGSRTDGFLAHELQEVIPAAAHGTKDEVDAEGKPVYQGIDQSKIVPLLTAALQEALAEIANLKTRITNLETKP